MSIYYINPRLIPVRLVHEHQITYARKFPEFPQVATHAKDI